MTRDVVDTTHVFIGHFFKDTEGAGYICTSFGHLATLKASRGGGNTARGIYCSWDILARGIYLLVDRLASLDRALCSAEYSNLILRALCIA